jgi:hypothetical protein
MAMSMSMSTSMSSICEKMHSLKQRMVQEVLGVPSNIVYESCSERVGDALGPDVMKSVKYLIPDILSALPLLLYQGEPLLPPFLGFQTPGFRV